MALNVSDYIEAILNPNGRFRTLDGIYPVTDEAGDLIMSVGEICADFETIYDGESYTLECLLGAGENHRQRLQEIAAFTKVIDTPYLAPSLYLENEMLVFDSAGKPYYVDVLLQKNPNGMRLNEFLAEMTSMNDTEPIHKAIKGLAQMARWLAANNFHHGNLNSRNIVISPSLTPVLVNYKNAERKGAGEETRLMCCMAAGLFCCACEPRLYDTFIADVLSSRNRLSDVASELENLLIDEKPSAFKYLVLELAEGKADAERLLGLADELAEQQPEKIAAFKTMVEAITQYGRNLPEDNMRKYVTVGNMHCNKMRAFDGGFWHYLDKSGEVVISGMFIGATDFYEGRAVIETESGYGMIDGSGRSVMDPEYDDLEWDGYNNIAVATREGLSGIFSRNGEAITGLVYDHVLNCSEDMIPVRKGKLFGYIHRDGSPAIELRYEDAFSFRDGFARVKRNGREYLIDHNGKEFDNVN